MADMKGLRPVTIIGLFQVLTVFVGMLAVRIVLKMNGYPDDDTLRWNPSSLFLRDWGSILLLIPVGWTILTLRAEKVSQPAVPPWLLYAVGVLVLIGLIGFCCWSCGDCYTRPMLINVGR
jgi:hypothetical protein